MTDSSQGLLGSWTPPECPFKITYSLRALDDIRLAVMDAFFSLPRGGAEIGGVLLGKREGSGITILDRLQLDCEHAFGPSFSLSPRDLAHLSALIEDAKKNIPDLQPVGWYHSHTRSDIFLSEADLDIQRRYFPNPWQVALVLKPHTFHPMRAGFFFREPDGSYHSEASYQEFVLDPMPARPLPPGNGESGQESVATGRMSGLTAADEKRNGSPAQLSVQASTPASANDPMAPADHEAAEAAAELAADKETAAAEDAAEAAAAGSADDAPFRYMEVHAPRRWKFSVLLALAAALAIGALAFETRSVWLPKLWGGAAGSAQSKTAATLGLDVTDYNGELKILWDRKNPAIQAATRGTLEIADGGGLPRATRLDAAELANGSFRYRRETERVDVILSVDGPGGELGRELASFLGKIPDAGAKGKPPAPDTAVAAERDALAVQVEKLKRDLKAETTRNQQLLKSMDLRGGLQVEAEKLQNQLTAEMARNRELEKASKSKDEQLAKLRSDLATQIAHNKVMGESLDALQAQVKLQQKKRMGNQAGDTSKQ